MHLLVNRVKKLEDAARQRDKGDYIIFEEAGTMTIHCKGRQLFSGPVGEGKKIAQAIDVRNSAVIKFICPEVWPNEY